MSKLVRTNKHTRTLKWISCVKQQNTLTLYCSLVQVKQVNELQ